ncbi:MAG: radical SAM protein, partial [bacterium]
RPSVEIMRGCTRGCRFCQAGMVNRPVRERSAERVVSLASSLALFTGGEEVGLIALNPADHSQIDEITSRLSQILYPHRIGISLSSLRLDTFSLKLAEEIQRVRKTTLTFAPETTQRLRNVLNKNITDEEIFNTIETALSLGWRAFKLYLMIGVPEEQKEDIEELGELIRGILKIGKKQIKRLHLSVSPFMPKPHTPFQWRPQLPIPILQERMQILRKSVSEKRVEIDFHSPYMSFVETALARGDRRVSRAILKAWEKGCRMDSWEGIFNFNRWLSAFQEVSINPYHYVEREIPYDEPLPWEIIDIGISKEFLIRENERAKKGETTPDCRYSPCSDCGVCFNLKVKNELASSK